MSLNFIKNCQKGEIEYLVVLTIELLWKERATRYRHAKAYYVIILRNHQDAKSHIIRILILPFIYILL